MEGAAGRGSSKSFDADTDVVAAVIVWLSRDATDSVCDALDSCLENVCVSEVARGDADADAILSVMT